MATLYCHTSTLVGAEVSVPGGNRGKLERQRPFSFRLEVSWEARGAGGETRTHDLGIMRPSLYP